MRWGVRSEGFVSHEGGCAREPVGWSVPIRGGLESELVARGPELGGTGGGWGTKKNEKKKERE